MELNVLKDEYSSCNKCEELVNYRSQVVFGSQHMNKCPVMIIGEAPGKVEDENGEPFIGRSGQILNKFLEEIGLTRDDVFITNTVLCRPPENRNPNAEEITRYLSYLTKHIEIIDPKILILLGSTALNAIIGGDQIISDVRGKWIEKKIGKCSTSIIVSFHPAFLMRQPDQKSMSWIDLKMIRKKISDLKIKIGK